MQDTHAAVYKQLGDWVRSCYGTPIASTSGTGFSFVLSNIAPGTTFDRVQLQEDTRSGQRVRNYTVAESVDGGASWQTLATGSAIGTKAILLLPANVTTPVDGTYQLRFRVDHAIASPVVEEFAVFRPCATQ